MVTSPPKAWETIVTEAISDTNPPRALPSDPLWSWWTFFVLGETFLAAGRGLGNGQLAIVTARELVALEARAGEVERSLVVSGLVPARPL